MELDEQAVELGFKSYEDALNHGYVLEYEGGKLVPTEEIMKQAHEAWLKEREIVLGDLMNLMIHKAYDHSIIERAYNFIKKGEM